MTTKISKGALGPDAVHGKRVLRTCGGTGLGKELTRAFSAQGSALPLVCGRAEQEKTQRSAG